jgi:hypothetical protein
MHIRFRSRSTALAALSVAAAALCGVTSASAAPTATLFVKNGAVSGDSGHSCQTAAYSTIGAAVAAAAPGSRIVVCTGTYDEGVVLSKPLALRGEHAVIDATTAATGNGVQITRGGSGSSVEGFTIENATFEGILVGTAPVAPATVDGTPATGGEPVSDVTIADNVLVHNDAGFGGTAGQCFTTPNAPGDCGEGIHLVSVTNSLVAHNTVENNAGGILMTDEFGPSSGNVIRGNHSLNNTDDCGITVAGHSAAVDPASGIPTGLAGIFDNVIEGNVSIGNGVAGQGAGIILAGGAPFAGVFDNTIRDNVAVGNGLAGVAIHQHLIGDLNGNVIEGNVLRNDNLDGDFDFAAAPDADTTGILIASGVPPGPELPPFLRPGPITGTVIANNRFENVKVGIWTLGVDPATTTITGNHFGSGVITPVSAH